MTVGASGANAAKTPGRRRDARRNRELLIEAAHEVFTEQGLEAPLDVIARRAGIGNATLYRHFPSRTALVDAVFRDVLRGSPATSPLPSPALTAPQLCDALRGLGPHRAPRGPEAPAPAPAPAPSLHANRAKR